MTTAPSSDRRPGNNEPRPVYLDYQATTPMDPRVLEAMMPYFTEKFGNPHSRNHVHGWEAEAGVEKARAQVAELINADEREIVFTSGATESNNLAIAGVARFYKDKRNQIVTLVTEHKCVLDTCRHLQGEGVEVTYLPVRTDGLVDLAQLAAELMRVGAVELRTGDEDLVFVTSDAQLLHFAASSVRPQGRTAGGMAGIKLAAGAHAVFFSAVDPAAVNLVVTSSGSSGALPGTEPGSLKVTPYAEYPAKGRATGGVRCHRFLRGEDTLVLGWVGGSPAKAAAANGVALELPEATGKRDGSGVSAATPINAIAGPLPEPPDPSSLSVPDAGSDDPTLPEPTPEFPAGRG